MLLFCLLLILATTFTVQGEAPKVTSATKYVKQYSVFGATVNVGIVELEFDQELYALHALPRACPGACPDVTATQAAAQLAASCGKKGYCKTGKLHVTLDNATQTFSRDLPSGPSLWWTENTQAVTNCSVNVHRFMPLEPGSYIQTLDDKTGGGVEAFWSGVVGVRHQLYCNSPATPLQGQDGLDYVGAFDSGQYLLSDYDRHTSIRYELYQFPISAPVAQADCILPAPYNATHKCLQLGIEDSIARDPTLTMILRYAIPVPTGCFTLTAYTMAEVMWISDSEPYQDGLTIYPDSTTAIYEPRPLHINNPLDEQENTFTRAFCMEGDGQQYIWVYARVLPYGSAGYPNVNTRFSIDFNWVDNIPFSELSPLSFAPSLLNTITVTLADGSKKFTNFHEETPLYTTFDTGVMNVRALWPSETPSFFANLHWSMRYDARFGQSFDSRTYPFVPKKFAIGVLLDQDFDALYNPSYVMPRRYQYLTEDEFMSASFTLHGTFGNADMEVVYTTLNASDITVKNITCDPEAFRNISAQIKQYLDETNLNADVNSLAFTIDMLAQEDVYVACFNEMLSRTQRTDGPVFEYNTTNCLYDFGTAEYATDPCCNISLSNYATCATTTKNQTYPILADVDVSVFDNVCVDPDCAKLNTLKLADEYIRVTAPDGCRSRLPQYETFQSDAKEVLYHCRTQFFNSRADLGLPCTHDADCSNGAKCSSLGYGCLADQDTQLLAYLQCALGNLTEFQKHTLADQISVDYADLSPATIRDSFLLDACVDPEGLLLGAFTRLFIGQFCAAPDQCENESASHMLDTLDSAFLRNDCYYVCSRSIGKNSITALCEDPFCNFNQTACPGGTGMNTSQCEEACLGSEYTTDDTFCGICDNGMECDTNLPAGMDVSNSDACTSAIVCILNNGTRIITNTEDECTNMMTCLDGTFTDSGSCLDQYHCTDSTDYANGLFVGSFGAGGDLDATGGICTYNVTFPEPFNQVVVYCNGYSHLNIFVCLDPSVSKEQCNYNSDAFPGYVINFIEWIEPAKNQSYCERIHGCYGPPVLSDGPADDWTAFESTCTDPSWTWEPFYKWEQTNTWRGGQVRNPQWKNRAVGPRWVNGTVFGHENWYATWENVFQTQYNQLLQSFVYCQHSRTTALLDRLVCNCKAGENDTFCNSQEYNTFNDVGTVCGGGDSTIDATPFTFAFPNNSINGTNCETLYFTGESIYTFQDSTDKPHLSNVVINFQEDSTWALRNDNEAIWGKVLTDGVYINSTTGDVAKFNDVTITVRMSLDRLNPDLSVYPILDLAYANGTALVLTPLYQNVTIRSDGYSYTLTTSELLTNRTYYVVQRVENWDTLPRTVFTNGEIAYIAVILFLYVMLFLLAIVKLGRAVYITIQDAGRLPMSRLLIIMTLITIFTIFRVVLFSILISQQIVKVNSGGSYVLIEFPILLYFVYVTNYIIMWAYIRRNSNKLKGFSKGWVTMVNAITIILNVFILALFVLIIILYEEVVGDPTPICEGEVVVWNTNAANVIGLVYRCVFGAIDITIGIAFIFVGYMFSQVLHSMSSNQEDMRRKVLAVSIVGSCGLLAQGIVWIVFPATGQTQSNYLSLSILIAVEIVPTTIFLLLIRERSIRATATSARSVTKSKAGASKKTSASTTGDGF